MEVAFQRDKFNCQQCRFHRHCDDTNPAPIPMFSVTEIGLESRTCLLPMITPQSHEFMRLYGHYRNQLLPYPGGLYDQPALYAEAMEVIDAQQARVLSEQAQAKKYG